jgi:RimJ/RimL family protein N-acetyltransferase
MITVGTLETTAEHAALGGSPVRLVPMSLDHVDALTAAATADRSTFDLAPIPRVRAQMVAYVERALADQAALRNVPFVVEQGGAILGAYRLMSLEWWSWPDGPVLVDGDPRVPPADPPDVAEIGHAWIVPGAQRTPVNTAACYLLMRQAFDVWNVHRLVLKTDARNTRSRNAITRLGGKLEGILRSHSPAADGIVRDVAMFSIVRAEWPETRMRLESILSGTHNPGR